MLFVFCFFKSYCDHRDLHVLTHSFPTRRSSDLLERSLITLDTRTGDKAEPLYTSIGYQTAGIIPDFCRDTVEDRLDPTTIMRSEEHTSELQSLMRISYAVFCLKKKKTIIMTT